MEFDREGRRIPNTAQVSLLLPKKRGRGRPRKYPDQTSTEAAHEPNEVLQPFVKKRGRGRPRKYPDQTSMETKRALKKPSETKIKIKLLETILGVYKEIKCVENENQKNIKKLCALVEALE